MSTLRDDVYPDFVAHFYVNTSRDYGQVSIDSYVKRVSFTLNRSVIRKILRIELGGEVYRDNITRKEQLKVLYG